MIGKMNRTVFLLIICCKLGICCSTAQTNNIVIKGVYNTFTSDSLELMYWRALPNNRVFEHVYGKQTSVVDADGQFVFRIASSEPVYLELRHYLKDNHQRIVFSNYIAEPGDSIVMTTENDTLGLKFRGQFAVFKQGLSFAGRGAAKFRCKNMLDSLINEVPDVFPTEQGMDDDYGKLMRKVNWSYQRAKATQQHMLDGLKLYKDSLAEPIYKLYWLDISAQSLNRFYKHLNLMVNNLKSVGHSERSRFEAFYENHLKIPVAIDTERELESVDYSSYLLNKYQFESSYFGQYSVLDQIDGKHSGRLKERLLTEYLVLNYNRIEEKDKLNRYIAMTFTPYYRQLLLDLQENQAVGNSIGNYEFTGVDGKSIRLSDFKGKVIFLDFWFTGCGGCLLYHRNMVSKVERKLRANPHIVFVSVSIDVEKKKWLESISSGRYTSTAAVNLFTGGKGDRHPIIDHLGIKSYPRPLVIDKQGKIYSNNQTDLRTSPEKLEEVILSALK